MAPPAQTSAKLERILASFDDTLPLSRARTLARQWYTDPDIYELERRSVFRETWQALGRVDALQALGAFQTVEIAGELILLARGQDGVLRAMSNVCRHNAAIVERLPHGVTARFRCRYHGWTYGCDGRLLGVPEFKGVEEFAREDHGLPQFQVDTWGPLVWVRIAPQAGQCSHHAPRDEVHHAERDDYTGTRITLAEAIGPLMQRIDQQKLQALRWHERREYDVACNWKVFVNNYLDGGYHVNTVHPGLAGAIDYAHYRTEQFDRCSAQLSPLVPSDDPTVAGVRSGEAAYWWVYPNFMLNLYENVMDTNLVLPTGPETCRVIFDFYFGNAWDAPSPLPLSPTVGERGRGEGDGSVRKRQSNDLAEQIQREDMDICADVQRGLQSLAYSEGRFGLRESGAYHFQRLLAGHVRRQFRNSVPTPTGETMRDSP